MNAPIDELLLENRRQKELLDAIIQASPAGFAIVSGDKLIFRIVNPIFRELLPRPDTDPVGHPWKELWADEFGRRTAALLHRVLETRDPIHSPQHIQRLPDSARIYSFKFSYFTWNNEPAVLIVLWDVTSLTLAREGAERAAREANRVAAEMESIFNGITDSVIVFDYTGQPIRANPAFITTYGYDPVGKRHAELARLHSLSYPDGRLVPFDQLPSSRILKGEIITGEHLLITTLEGEQRYIQFSGNPLLDLDGVTAGAVLMWRDETAEVNHRKQLEMEHAKLEHSNKELENFAFIASHDMQEPLRKIVSFGIKVQQRLDKKIDPETKDFLERMQSAAQRMITMVDELLQLSRVTTAGLPFVRVDLNKIVEEVLADLEVRLREENGQVDVCTLPQITADPVQMHQLFQNLISNALKYHKPDQAPVVRISIEEGSTVGGKVKIMIEDNGIGFDQKNSEKIFEPFKRLVNKSEYSGSGIGLAICKKIVERHNGSISARGQIGIGSVFTIVLPGNTPFRDIAG